MGMLLGVGTALWAPSAFAQTSAPETSAPEASTDDLGTTSPDGLPVVRLTMSAAAQQYLTEVRIRRLVGLELAESAPIADEPVGPLDEEAIRIFVDLPQPALVVAQIKAPKRRMIVRRINVTGLPWDVSARFVAIAISEAVRRQLRPLPPKPPPAPTGPTPEELARQRRQSPSLVTHAGLNGAAVPAAEAWLAGPAFELGLHGGDFVASVGSQLVGGASDPGTMRYWDVGAAVDYRIWASDSIRFTLGARGAIGLVKFSETQMDRGGADVEQTEQASGTAGGRLRLEARLATDTWLFLGAEPAAIVRPVAYGPSTGGGAFEGLWLGATLGIAAENLLIPVTSAVHE